MVGFPRLLLICVTWVLRGVVVGFGFWVFVRLLGYFFGYYTVDCLGFIRPCCLLDVLLVVKLR